MQERGLLLLHLSLLLQQVLWSEAQQQQQQQQKQQGWQGQPRLPLLALPPEVPFVLLMRHVEQTIAAERYEELRAGWELADECTRLAADGRSLASVLSRVAAFVGAQVTVVDQGGFELISAGSAAGGTARTTLRLPDHLKSQAEVAAAREGVSVNTWLVRAVAAALETSAGSARNVRRTSSAGRLTSDPPTPRVASRHSSWAAGLASMTSPRGLMATTTSETRSNSVWRAIGASPMRS